MTAPVLSVRDLRVGTAGLSIVEGISFDLGQGEILGLVGESGSGKTIACRAVMRLLPSASLSVAGEVIFGGRDLIPLPEGEMRRVRGRGLGMVFQDPASHLDPVMRIGEQIGEGLRLEGGLSRREARAAAVDLLRQVGIPNPEQRVDDFPHQFSGGMRQRAMIAMSLVNDPKLLIADEPTTALDVTVQAQILDLLQDLQREFDSAIIMITHDLGVIAEMADDVLVMYAGRAVETGPTKTILTHPQMPYTWGLLSSVPDISADTDARLIPIPGNPPSLLNPPSGCPFNPRCVHKDKVPGDLCTTTLPELLPATVGEDHYRRCHIPDPETIYLQEVLPEIAPDLVDANPEQDGA